MPCHAMVSQIKPVSSSTCSAYVSWCTAFLCTHGAGRHIISMSPEASEVHLSAKIWFSPEHPQKWNQQTTYMYFFLHAPSMLQNSLCYILLSYQFSVFPPWSNFWKRKQLERPQLIVSVCVCTLGVLCMVVDRGCVWHTCTLDTSTENFGKCLSWFLKRIPKTECTMYMYLKDSKCE
jgi:hypothetical protein